MYRFIVILFTVLILAVPSYALPALKGVGSISTATEEVIDNTFANKLEHDGYLENALLEWQRIYYSNTTSGQKEHALFKVAILNCNLKRYELCLKTFKNLGEKYPDSKYIPEALYNMSIAADKIYKGDGKVFRERLLSSYPKNKLTEKALYLVAWQNAQNGKITPAHGFESIKKLNEKTQQFNAIHADIPRTAGSLAVIPGGGHFYLADWQTGLMAFLHIMLFGWAVFYAIKHKHWPYVIIFGLVLGILYVGSIFSAYSLAKREIQELRLIQMQQWNKTKISANLYPTSSPLQGLFWYQRNVVGKFDGERGNGYPVNSLYAKQAMEKFGSGYGLLMTVDRLLRDWREITNPLARVFTDGRSRYVDTLARNTFWINNDE